LLLKPEASMVSAVSTVIEFSTPDTVRLAQWPVITMVLDTPLTLTMLLLQATVRFSLIPEMLSWPPGSGAGDVVGFGVRPVDGVGMRGAVVGAVNVPEMVGGDEMIDRTLENWCAAMAAIPPTSRSTPMTISVPRIHQMRLLERGFGGGPVNGPP